MQNASKHWIGTSYKEKFEFDQNKLDYAVWQQEKCPSTGRLHFQFIIGTKNRCRFNTAKAIIKDKEAHIEHARDIQKSVEYCSKQETRVDGPFYYGATPKAKQTVVEGLRTNTVQEYLTENPQLWRAVRNLREVRGILSKPRQICTEGILLTGETGKGKSKIAGLISNYLGTYFHSGEQWWDGYDAEPLVVVDEYRGTWTAGYILQLLNHLPFRVQYKGGSTQFTSHTVIFTSNLRLADIIKQHDIPTQNAIRRRIKEYIVY